MNRESVIQILQSALQPDGEKRSAAEKSISAFVKSDYSLFLTLFVQVMLDTYIQFQNRQMASLVLKKYFHSKTPRIQKSYESLWLSLPISFRMDLIALLHKNLNIKENTILLNISKIYGSIIRIELANGTQADIFSALAKDISSADLAVGILESLSYACDQLYEETMFQFTQEKPIIYKIATFYLNTNNQSNRNIIFSSLKCILSSMEIYEDLLNTEEDKKKFIYQIYMCPKEDIEVLEISLDVLNRLVDVYTSLSDSEVSFICQAFLSYFETSKSNLPIQVFDFWKILIDLEKFTVLNHFIPTLVPNLFMCLGNEEFDNTIVTPHKAATSLLLEIVNKAKIPLINNQQYQNFISDCFKSNDTEKHAIGCMALGCICSSGSDNFIFQMLPSIINCLEIENCICESLFALSQICAKDISVTVEFLPVIVQKVGFLIQNKSKSSVHAVMVYNSILSSMKTHNLTEVENVVFYHYADILFVLINRLDQSNPEEYDTRSVINSTLTELINTCPPVHKDLLNQLEAYLFNKITTSILDLKQMSEDQILVQDDVLCSYVILLTTSLTLKQTFQLERLFEVFYECLNLPKMLLRGEVYIAISKLLSHFSVHLKKFIPFIIRDLSCDEIFVFKAALNLLSDCALYLETSFSEFTPAVIPALANAITSPEVALELKPLIIVSLGDIALSIGRGFEPYISLCVLLSSQISTLNREGDEDYVDNLKKSVVSLFSCLFVSLGDTLEMRQSTAQILENLENIIQSDREGVYVKESLDLISDIINLQNSTYENVGWIRHYLNEVIRNSNKDNCEKAKEIYGKL